MNRRIRLDFEAHHPTAYYGRRRRASNGRKLRRLALPVTATVLFAMVAIPLLSMGLVSDADMRRGPRESDSVQLVELPQLPGRPSDRASEIRSLKDWLRDHFSDEEIDEMRETFVDGRDPDQVRAEVATIADEISRGVYVNVPRYFADRVNDRLGRDRTQDLKGHFERIGSSPVDLEGVAVEEIFPEGP
jgi:hypothetical protein